MSRKRRKIVSKPADKPESKAKVSTSIFIPSATVFISSFCIMVLELVASRLIGRNLGSSLYTWTAVIGVILSGITIGNYLGGRIADKFDAKKSIAVLFTVCSAACVTTIISNNLVGRWIWLWQFSWPLRVFSYVALVFLIPSTLLGTISPVVAKMALDNKLPVGRTVGSIYAWGAAGSIAGTFAAGYWLIATMGSTTVIWVIGAVLLLMGIWYWKGLWPLYIWGLIFVFLATTAMTSAKWAKETGVSIALRGKRNPKILYEDESRYCYITVEQASDNPYKRYFYQDKLKHSEILMNNELNLQYHYTQIYAAVTEGLSRNKEKLCVMAIGGGGYVFPRYIEKVRPGSRIDVVEIDADVTKAAVTAFGLDENARINTINMDARNYVDQLLEQKHKGEEIPQYDFIYGDAFNDYSVPFQLVTQEFNEKIFSLLGDDGVYIINLIDIFDSGLFLGSVINTLEKTFPNIYVLTHDEETLLSKTTFIIIAAKAPFDLKDIISQYKGGQLTPWHLNEADISELRQKSRHLVLTDNYSPVENLLAPVVCNSAKMIAARHLMQRAESLKRSGEPEKSIKYYLRAIKRYPVFSAELYHEIGTIYNRMGSPEQAVEAFNKAITCNEEAREKISMARVHYNLGMVLTKLGKETKAAEHFGKAAEAFRKRLIKNPANSEWWSVLGDSLMATGDFEAAVDAFKKARDLDAAAGYYYNNLVEGYERNGLYNEAIAVLKRHIQLMQYTRRDEDVVRLRKYLKVLEYKNAK
ncbi:MAG: fused MFS/spermidine synthase [Sedimentisphaerales bacterium]|nr:fused MFS/spermidine synthase [Sedimentisphaerales bacterium]